MKREDFLKMGFNLELPTIDKVLRAKDSPLKYKEFTPEETKIFIHLNCMKLEEMEKALLDKDWQNDPFVQMANNWVKRFPNVFDEKIWLFVLLCFGIDSPGKLNIFIARCLEFYIENEIKITPDTISMQIFPFGFYNDDTCRNIIDICMKPKASLFSEIY